MLTTLGFGNTGIKWYEKQLQFPTGVDPRGRLWGIFYTINEICNHESIILKNTFYLSYTASKKYSSSKLDNLIRCYRYFKECCNCIMHHGGLADQKLLDAYNEFARIANITDLGLEEVPLHAPIPFVGERIKLHLRGVVGLGDVIIRIMTTRDSEPLRSKHAKQDFAKRWRSKHNPIPTLKTKYIHQRYDHLKRLFKQIYRIDPNDVVDMKKYLTRNGFAK
ncbi:hypothetical protein [Gorillibacterium timonense]|uniref:hypothetical protein n=1 Tax=Gorillibacterium timonense TaxID=1689269 RepID=UPI0011DCF1EB|nr:hypothetical protein [Gorillibacterium timonense]